jgi:AbrB family looped-hinge helix DNA binding protein
MSPTSVKVNTKYQITIPETARKKLNLKQGDRLLVDVQEGVIVLAREPKLYTDHLWGLDSEIWKGIDVQAYIRGERKAWTKSKKPSQ